MLIMLYRVLLIILADLDFPINYGEYVKTKTKQSQWKLKATETPKNYIFNK